MQKIYHSSTSTRRQVMTQTDTIITARQYEVSQGLLLTYLCAGGLLSAFLNHRRFGLRPSIHFTVIPTTSNVVLMHSIDYPEGTNARNTELLVIPTDVFSKDAYEELQEYMQTQSSLPQKVTSDRISFSLDKFKAIREEIDSSYRINQANFALCNGLQGDKYNKMFLSSVDEHFEKVGISFSEAFGSLNPRLRFFIINLGNFDQVLQNDPQ